MIDYSSLSSQVLTEIWYHWKKERGHTRPEDFCYQDNYNKCKVETESRGLIRTFESIDKISTNAKCA